MLTLLLLSIKKYKGHLICLLGAIILNGAWYLYAYNKGQRKTGAKVQTAVAKVVVERTEQARTEVHKNRIVRQKITKTRQSQGPNDLRDSCILSNDPLRHDCLKN